MKQEHDPNTAEHYLTAFADGELDPVQTQQALDLLMRQPAATSVIAAHIGMRQAVSRVMSRDVPPLSQAARKRIENMMPEPAAFRVAPDKAQRTLRLWPAAVAAVLFLALGVWIGRSEKVRLATAPPVPLELISTAIRTHVDCSRYPSLHTGPFPAALGEMQESLKTYLGRSVPYPDLRPIGFEYVGAGPCDKPMERGAHLLYRSTRPSDVETVSLFVQPNWGQTSIDAGKVYRAAGKDAGHPMIVWRNDKLVFYLVSDAEDQLTGAAGALGLHLP